MHAYFLHYIIKLNEFNVLWVWFTNLCWKHTNNKCPHLIIVRLLWISVLYVCVRDNFVTLSFNFVIPLLYIQIVYDDGSNDSQIIEIIIHKQTMTWHLNLNWEQYFLYIYFYICVLVTSSVLVPSTLSSSHSLIEWKSKKKFFDLVAGYDLIWL